MNAENAPVGPVGLILGICWRWVVWKHPPTAPLWKCHGIPTLFWNCSIYFPIAFPHVARCSNVSNIASHGFSIDFPSVSQWEFRDPKMEVLYHIRPYFVGVFPYIGRKNRPKIYGAGTSNEYRFLWNDHFKFPSVFPYISAEFPLNFKFPLNFPTFFPWFLWNLPRPPQSSCPCRLWRMASAVPCRPVPWRRWGCCWGTSRRHQPGQNHGKLLENSGIEDHWWKMCGRILIRVGKCPAFCGKCGRKPRYLGIYSMLMMDVFGESFGYSVHLICAEYENINEGMSYHQYESVMCGFVWKWGVINHLWE